MSEWIPKFSKVQKVYHTVLKYDFELHCYYYDWDIERMREYKRLTKRRRKNERV